MRILRYFFNQSITPWLQRVRHLLNFETGLSMCEGAACRISTYKIRILHSPEHTRTGKQHSRWKQRFDVCSKLQAYYNAALDFQFTLYIRLYLCTFCIA